MSFTKRYSAQYGKTSQGKKEIRLQNKAKVKEVSKEQNKSFLNKEEKKAKNSFYKQ